jgi:SagB-type dehydrogenase family enzyme
MKNDEPSEPRFRFLDATEDELFRPSEIYHENSKLRASDTATFVNIATVNTSLEIRSVITRPFSNYPGFPRIPLTRDFAPAAQAFETILRERCSSRDFSGEPGSLESLAKILYLGDGIARRVKAPDGTEWLLRTAPSGGGLFPVDLYCFILNVEQVAPGLYFYNVLDHCLEQVVARDFTPLLRETTALEGSIDNACACIVMVGFMQRAKFKYGERAYRFVLLEAGHIAQNVLLAAQAEGLGAVPVGGFLDDPLNESIGLDGCDEVVLYLVLLGRPRADRS